MAALHPELARLLDENSANLRRAEALVAGLSPAQFNWRPEPAPNKQSWSIGECLSHMNIINRAEPKTIDAAIADARARGINSAGPYRYGFLSTWFVKNMDERPKRKFKAPKYYVPPSESDLVQTLEEYRRNSAAIAVLMEKANGLDLARVKIPLIQPKWAKMPLGARFALITAHDRRHLWQAEQVRLKLQ
jgi:hypothetical protein